MYLYSKSKGADQLHSYHAADLCDMRLCFCMYVKSRFSLETKPAVVPGSSYSSKIRHQLCTPWSYEPRSGFPTRSDTNRAVQPQKMARGLKRNFI